MDIGQGGAVAVAVAVAVAKRLADGRDGHDGRDGRDGARAYGVVLPVAVSMAIRRVRQCARRNPVQAVRATLIHNPGP
jgi:hypothetical protein